MLYPDPGTFGISKAPSENLDQPPFAASSGSWGTLGIETGSKQRVYDLREVFPPGSAGSLLAGFLNILGSTTLSAHTVVNVIVLPFASIEDEEGADAEARVASPQLAGALQEIRTLTGLKKTRIAEDLFGVSRQAFNAWERGQNISEDRLAHVLDTLDILKRASRLYRTPQDLRAWLNMPRGAKAERPRDLLKMGQFGKARLLAISMAPPRDRPVPEWVLRSTPDPWTSAHMRWSERSALDDESVTVPDIE